MIKLKKYPFSSILGWSVTRYDAFRFCKRQYYYNYYGKFDTEFETEKIAYLKGLTSVPLEIGNVVHDILKVVLERLLISEKDINVDRFYSYARRKTAFYCESKDFSEVYYKQVPAIDMDAVQEKVRVCCENFLNSDRFQWVINEAVPNKTEWLIEPGGFGETRIEGMKAYCKVDFLFPMGDELIILDWKTGKPNETKQRKQMVGYSAWAAHHFDHDPAKIKPVIAFLFPEYKEHTQKVNEFDVQELVGTIRDDTEEMRAMCVDVEENIPRDKSEFPMCKSTRMCGWCSFRELCGRMPVRQ